MTTNDPHGSERGRPEDPATGGQDPMQGRQDPVQGRQDPVQGGQDPMQGGQDPMQGRQDPGQGRQQGQARYEEQGAQRGTYETRQAPGAHEVKAEKSRGSHTARLGVLTGLLGLIALGGVTAGLVASNAATTHVPSVTPTHVPSHASASPSASPTTGAKRLVVTTGSASAKSASFVMPTSTESAHYTYTCPASLASSPHGFAAQIENAAGTDVLPIAASRNMSGSGTVIVHPKDVGSPYHIVTTTNCPYTIKVDSP